MGRVILHVDANSFYASVECLYRPEMRNTPLSVCGDPEQRHGIVLASNQLAKKWGVKTGMAVWQAKQACPKLITVPPDYKLYLHFSSIVGKSKLLDFPTMPTTAESFPLLISLFPYTLNLYLVNAIMSLFKL